MPPNQALQRAAIGIKCSAAGGLASRSRRRRHVNIIGRREERVDAERVIELLGQLYSARFFSMGDNFTYGQFLSPIGDDEVQVNQIIVNDSSPTTMTVTIAAYQKSIVWDPFFSPRELSTLRDRILEVAGVERWLK